MMSSSSNKLPALKLPTFSGKYAEYKNFITTFKQVIDREIGLSNINAFRISNNNYPKNYPKALERLKSRFDNNILGKYYRSIWSAFHVKTWWSSIEKHCWQCLGFI